MKAIGAICILAFCCIASATLLQDVQRQTAPCSQAVAPISVFSGCSGSTLQDICTDSCYGEVCDYWNDEGAQDCSAALGQVCEDAGANRPSGCGALILVTIKGVMVVMLLLAAFFTL